MVARTTGNTGVATDSPVYDAFGETLTRSGSTATPVQFAGASGYQADAATGLMLLGHRYYDASVGRFLSSDPAQAGSNWYAYCDNNPLVGVDPTGLIRNIKWNGQTWTSRISDPDIIKGFPHWDGPGGFIGNDGKFHPDHHGRPQNTNETVRGDVKREVEKLRDAGHKIIPPKQWVPYDPGLTDVTGDIGLPLVGAPLLDPFPLLDGVGEALGTVGNGLQDTIGGIIRGIGSIGRGLVRVF